MHKPTDDLMNLDHKPNTKLVRPTLLSLYFVIKMLHIAGATATVQCVQKKRDQSIFL